MHRKPIAALAICLFVIGWIVAASVLADFVRPLSWAVQAIYFPLAGFLWVFPVWWLMLWAVRRR
jgi:hypothetical protein